MRDSVGKTILKPCETINIKMERATGTAGRVKSPPKATRQCQSGETVYLLSATCRTHPYLAPIIKEKWEALKRQNSFHTG